MKSLTIICICLMLTIPCIARTITVDDDGPANFNNIQAAISDANNGDTVLVKDGTYIGEGNRDIDFLGKTITVRSQHGPENCIIDCQGNKNRGFYFHNGEDANSLLEGFSIINSRSYKYPSISCNSASPTIKSCKITDNRGGLIFCRNSSPLITGCTITGTYRGIGCSRNSSPTITDCIISNNRDGGIYSIDGHSDLTIDNCTISDNTGEGGIHLEQGSLTITNSTISGNYTWKSGGGIYFYKNCVANISNCTITDNYAKGSGGGVASRSGNKVEITNSAISGNESGRGGGLFGCTGPISNCIISGNKARDEGGGLSSCDTILNCVISGNKAQRSVGGLSRCNIIINCTIVGNLASDDFGGGAVSHDTDTLINSIVWANSPEQIDIGTPVSYCNVQGGFVGLGNINQDPYFVMPGYWADANDPNVIVEPNDPNAVWVDGDYHLLLNSPCIDTGDPNYIPEPNETDLDGNPRVYNDRIDMGAYEYTPPVEVEVKLTPQMLSCDSHGNWLKAHVTFSEEIYPEDIDVNSPAIADPPGVESEFIVVNEFSDGSFDVQIYFDRESFCQALSESEDGSLEVTVTGSFIDGRKFQGSDTIHLQSPPWQHRIRRDINRERILQPRKTKQ